LEGDDVMGASCNEFFDWCGLCLSVEVVWVLRVGDMPISCAVLSSRDETCGLGVPVVVWVAFFVHKSAPVVVFSDANELDWEVVVLVR
jgi:hypothetical protein